MSDPVPPPDLLSWILKNSTNIRDLLVGFGTLIAFFSLLAAVMTARAALRQADIAAERHSEQTKADRERRITDGFTKAAELLGKREPEVRLGAIYTLERIAHESPQYHWPVMETLAAYLRTKLSPENLPSKPADAGEELAEKAKPLPVDLNAVLTVFAQRERKHDPEGHRINLSGVRLSRADLTEANLSGANLSGADLSRADLTWTDLSGVRLGRADLSGAVLYRADLSGALLSGANLSGAQLRGANLSGADLSGADLSRARLTEANLSGTILSGANLTEADLSGTVLSGTVLSGTVLSGANLTEANLSGVLLSKADLSGDLSGADLTKAVLEIIKDTKLCRTIMPDGTVNNRD
jgi:uncharacterized protein YjbI with pentapeptide repeats